MRRIRTPLITAIAIGLLAGSSVGVAAQEAPAEFTGQWSHQGQVLPDTEESGDGWELTTGGAWRFRAIDVTDPRFDGEVGAFTNWYDINPGTAESMDIRSGHPGGSGRTLAGERRAGKSLRRPSCGLLSGRHSFGSDAVSVDRFRLAVDTPWLDGPIDAG